MDVNLDRDSRAPRVGHLPTTLTSLEHSRLRFGLYFFAAANVMVFLASDYASYMTGEVVAVSN